MHRIFNGSELPSRPELRQYGYAPGNYMGRCRVGEHTVHNIDKRASCCLECAEKLHKEKSVVADNPNLQIPAPRDTSPAAKRLIETQYGAGKLTAMKNTAIALTVERVDGDGQVCTMQFVGTDLKRERYNPDVLIGAGDELVFSSGVFVRAQ